MPQQSHTRFSKVIVQSLPWTHMNTFTHRSNSQDSNSRISGSAKLLAPHGKSMGISEFLPRCSIDGNRQRILDYRLTDIAHKFVADERHMERGQD